MAVSIDILVAIMLFYPTAVAGEVTCGELKTLYKGSGCCGSPGKLATGCIADPTMTISVYLERPIAAYHAVKMKSDATAGEFLQTVGELLGVHPDYLLAFRAGKAVDSKKRIAYRRDSMRIGCHSSCPNQQTQNAKTLASLGVIDGSSVTVALRPVRGDHIHYAFAVHIGGELVDILWDRTLIGTPFANEGKNYDPLGGSSDLLHDYHLTQTHPHFGIHSGQAYWFGDGLIHVHEGTSWSWFHETEGLGATLGAYLSQVGVAIYDAASTIYPIGEWHVPMDDRSLSAVAVTFPDKTGGNTTMVGGEYDCSVTAGDATTGPLSNGVKGQNIGAGRHPLRDFENKKHNALEMVESRIIIQSNSTHTWRTYYYKYYSDPEPMVVEDGMGDIWLHENLGLIVLSYELRDKSKVDPAPKPPQCQIDILTNMFFRKYGQPIPNQASQFYTLGFDGYSYPMPNGDPTADPYPHEMPDVLKQLAEMDRAPLL